MLSVDRVLDNENLALILNECLLFDVRKTSEVPFQWNGNNLSSNYVLEYVNKN